MQDEAFEWDDTKASANWTKHRVTFDAARNAFADAFALEFVDDRADYGEPRFVLIGMATDRLLTVAYTVRGERVRIISARPATAREKREYHEAGKA